MYRGNVDKVMTDAKRIAHRWNYDGIPLHKLMKEYHCKYSTIIRVIHSQIPQDKWLQIRREHLARGNVKSHFQKGHLPHNNKPLGTIVIHKPKREKPHRLIAIPGPTPNKHKWISYAQYLWEKKYGPVPPGLFVAHIDGDRLHDEIGNYKLVDRAGNIKLMKINNPNWIKKAGKTRSKICRIRRAKKAIASRKAQKEAEKIQKHQAKLLRAAAIEAEQKKAVETEKILLYGPQICVWECTNCSAEYEQKEMPDRCIKCGKFSFEKNFYQRKTG